MEIQQTKYIKIKSLCIFSFLRSCDEEKLKNGMPVDIYLGGVEHAAMHLLYARFMAKVYPFTGTPIEEPFKKLLAQVDFLIIPLFFFFFFLCEFYFYFSSNFISSLRILPHAINREWS